MKRTHDPAGDTGVSPKAKLPRTSDGNDEGSPSSSPSDEPTDTNPTAVLFSAILNDDVQQLDRALSEGASVDSTMAMEDLDVWWCSAISATALIYAIEGGSRLLKKMRTAKLLLERGANVNATDNNGDTPVSIAARKGDEEMVKLLAERGASLDIQNNDGETPVFSAAWSG